MAKGIDLKPIILLGDDPVHDHDTDELSLLPFAKAIAGSAMGTQGPFTIGVFAGWGQGKTSLLRQSRSLIDTQEDSNVVTVWFNAWQFENEPHPILPLIMTIANAVKENITAPNPEKPTQWEKLNAALSGLAYGFSAKVDIGFAKVGFSGKDAINREAEVLEKKQQEVFDEQSFYYKCFEALNDFTDEIKDDREDTHPKIVVFIDDLDRCLPQNALKILESIKLVLSQRGFVYVMAVDRKVLESYLTKRYSDEFGIEDYDSGVSYLDKIVQLPLPLPPHKKRFESYILGLLERDVFSHSSNRGVKKALQEIIPLLAVGSNHNPRTLVRTINNLIIDRHLMMLLDIKVEEEGLSLAAVSRFLQQHLGEKIFHCLVMSQHLCDQLRNHISEGVREDIKEAKQETKSESLILDALIEKLETVDFLHGLFMTKAAQSWLSNSEGRWKVYEFLATQRNEEVEDNRSQDLSVIEAIRNAGREDSEITQLNISSSGVEDMGLEHLKTLTGLKQLNLNRNYITGSGFKYLKGMSSLKVLNLSSNKIKDTGLEDLQVLTNLENLDLRGNQIKGVGLEYLQALTSLKYLNLGGNQIKDEDIEYLQALTSLEYLNLGGNQIKGIGLEHLKALISLRILELPNNQVTDTTFEHLKTLISLEDINLGGNQIKGAGLEYLKAMNNLRRLVLYDNQVTGTGLEHLKDITNLQRLILYDNQVTDAGLEHLKALTSLKYLHLSGNQVTDAGLEHLKVLTSLQGLYLNGNQITSVGLKVLKESLPNCSVTA